MSGRNLDELSKEELIAELQRLEGAENRLASNAGEADHERLIHDLHVHQVELEMQNRELRDAQERLEETSSRYSDLYDYAPVGYCTFDAEGRIEQLNLTAATLCGAPRDALLGRPFSSVAPLENKSLFHAHLRRCLLESGRVTSELGFTTGLRESRTVQLISDPVRNPNGVTTGYRTILVDISELKLLEGRLRLMSAAGERLTLRLQYAGALDEAARIAVPQLADVCVLDVRAADGALERKVVLFADPLKQASLGDQMMKLAPRAGWQTPQARVIASGEPMLLAEMPESNEAVDHDLLQRAGVCSLMVLPLIARGETLGALTLASAESERRYSALDFQVAQDLSSRIAMALDNTRLYDGALEANQALRLAEAKASGIVSISADAIISIDDEQRITLFNEGAQKIFGYSKAEAVGAPLAMLIPERLRATHEQHVKRFAGGEQVSRKIGLRGSTFLGLRKNGEEFPGDAAISKLQVGAERILTVALRDVTEEKRLESDQRLLAEVGLTLSTTLDYEDTVSKIAEVAARFLADFCIVGLLEERGDVRRLRVAGRDPATESSCAALRQVRIDRSRPHPSWSPLRTKQATLFEQVTPELLSSWARSEEHLRLLQTLAPRSVIAVPLLARGNVVGVLELVSTGRVYGQADLRVAEQLADRAANAIENAGLYRVASRAIQARDNVMGVVAHDLRNPLAGIVVQASMLRRRAPQVERRSQKPAEVIQRAAKRMNRLIQDLLDVTSIDAGRLSLEHAPVDVATTLSDLVDSQKPIATSKSISLRAELRPELGQISADRERLMQVLENLVGNALKSTESGGEITVGAAPAAGGVLFWVADTGSGIEADDLTHLFDRFWQARDHQQGGVGLGLPIVKGIVEGHGGQIWVESKLGVGTTFFFMLPRERHELADADKTGTRSRADELVGQTSSRVNVQ